MKDTVKIIFCDCNDPEHMIILEKMSDEPLIAVTYHLIKRSLWKRIVLAIKHICGFQSRYGAFGELLINSKEAYDLINYLGGFLLDHGYPVSYLETTVSGSDSTTIYTDIKP